ncbi:MAG TPA: YdeI/OmpD-associated family protein [Solirubrobacteraceae bacterium]|nr:YdeI/OmpD-associated family protein [Solirubrobacteraceae bacterium]
MPAPPRADFPVLSFASASGWEQWLEANHDAVSGVWLKFAKKGSPTPSLSQAEAVETALCFGWIDGQAAPHDDVAWLQRFTPRRSRSKWSQINRDKATRLIAEGRMRPAGHTQVELAKSDGRWEAAYEPQSTAQIPDDLAAELERSPKAAAFFATLNRVNRYAILYRIHDAKRPETRARRIVKFVEMLERGEKIHP